MEIRVLGCYGGETPGHRTTCFLINNSLLIDAGAVTAALPLKDQAKVEAILVSHSHLDHVRDLPFLADNIFGKKSGPLPIYALPETLKSIRGHLFNDMLWPDFSKLPTKDNPTISFNELRDGSSLVLEGLTVTPIKVNHAVPCAGFIVKNEKTAFALSSDTGPTENFWDALAKEKSVGALFLEISFPNRLAELAELSGHLTPAGARLELEKLSRPELPVYFYHMKPQFLREIAAEVDGKDPRLHFLHQGDRIEL